MVHLLTFDIGNRSLVDWPIKEPDTDLASASL